MGCPLKFEAGSIATSLFGLYNKFLGRAVSNLHRMHLSMLAPRIKNELDIDLESFLDRRPTMIEIDDKITSKLFGFENVHDYYERACC